MHDTLSTVEGLKSLIYLKNTFTDKRRALFLCWCLLYTVAGRTHEIMVVPLVYSGRSDT